MKNESAFPVTPTDKSGQCAPTQLGMSLRDYFAAKAMQGLLSSPRPPFTKAITENITAGDYTVLAYAMADYMLLERSKP